MTNEKFWFVWCPSHGLPTHRHPSETAAKKEAERLARKNRGHRFFVLEALESVCVDDVQWTKLEMGMPF